MFAVKEGYVELVRECFADMHLAATTKVYLVKMVMMYYLFYLGHIEKANCIAHSSKS